jgi:hypothetical protein
VLLACAEMTYFKYLADLEPVEVCMMIGTCMDTVLHKLQVSISEAASILINDWGLISNPGSRRRIYCFNVWRMGVYRQRVVKCVRACASSTTAQACAAQRLHSF